MIAGQKEEENQKNRPGNPTAEEQHNRIQSRGCPVINFQKQILIAFHEVLNHGLITLENPPDEVFQFVEVGLGEGGKKDIGNIRQIFADLLGKFGIQHIGFGNT